MLPAVLVAVLLIPGVEQLELSARYSAVSVPPATGYTAFCGRDVCSTAIQTGPEPTQMFGGGFAYFLRDHFGIYGDFGVVKTVQHTASSSQQVTTSLDGSTTTLATSTTTAKRNLVIGTGGVFVS